jgi:hypothetical protein
MSVTPETDALTMGARIADVTTAILLAVAAWCAVVATRGVFVLNVLILPPRPLLLVYAAVCVQVARHLLWPRPSLLWRVKRAHAAVVARPNVAAALRAFVATRPAVFLVAYFAVVIIGLTKPGFVLSRDPLANLPARFDAGWYGDIALDGYTWDHTFQRQRNIAFFPAMPMLMRPVGAAFGMSDRTVPRERRMLRALWAGVVISLGAFLWALNYVTRLGSDLIGPDRAAGAALLLAAYPFALFYNAPYTESLFLLGAAGACYHFVRGEWVAASLWGLLVGLTRPNGCLVSIPLAILGLQQLYRDGALRFARDDRSLRTLASDAEGLRGVGVRVLTAAMPGIGMLLFTAYLYRLTGVWFAWARSHEAWGRTYQGFGPFVAVFERLRDEPFLQVVTNNPSNTLNALGVLFGLALLYPVFRRLGPAWGAFVLVNLIPPLFAGGLLSMGRLSSTLFPLFLALAAIIAPRNVPAWAVVFGIGQGLCAALFFTWRDLY